MKKIDLFLGTVIVLVYTSPAYAYIDPGTGSMILASIVVGIVMAKVTLRFYWQKFVSLFVRNKTTQQSNSSASENVLATDSTKNKKP